MKSTASTLDYPAGNLHVTALRPRAHPFDRQPDLVFEQVGGGTGTDQVVVAEPVTVEGGEGDQVGLLAVVGDDRQARTGASHWHSTRVQASSKQVISKREQIT